MRRGEDNFACVSVHTQPPTLAMVRRALLSILVLGLFGTAAELLLLEHFEDAWQWTPLVLIALALIILAWHAVSRSGPSVRALRGTMLLFVVSGGVGFLLHYRGNVEFELEREPALRGFGLFREAMGGATPALAPGTMVLLGLVGLVYAYRHPALGQGPRPELHGRS